jgi:hypothetical protein
MSEATETNDIHSECSRPLFEIKRQAYKQSQFDAEFQIRSSKEKKNFFKRKANTIFKLLNPKGLLSLFTILNLITEYNLKRDLIADIFSGNKFYLFFYLLIKI